MGSIAIADQSGATAGVPVVARRLFVAWQDPATRNVTPVGRLDRQTPNGEVAYEFRYPVPRRSSSGSGRSSDSPNSDVRIGRRSSFRSSRTA